MKRLAISILLLFSLQFLNAQELRTYLFARAPHLVNYQFDDNRTSYGQGLSAGIGFAYKSSFLEFGSFIFEGNSYGHYSFFGSTFKRTELHGAVTLNTNWFGEVTHLPAQSEENRGSWIYTGGLCLFPNVQLQRLNIGVPMCLGLAYQEESIFLNSRFILNLSYNF